jgi:hypothetical protein
MHWSDASVVVVAGIAGVMILSLMFWSGHVLLNLLGDETPLTPVSIHFNDQAAPEDSVRLQVPDGQERLATKLERDDVSRVLAGPAITTAES